MELKSEEERFKELNREFLGCGIKMKEFCELKGINYFEFRNRRAAQTRRNKPTGRDKASKFVELKITNPPEYVIELPNGIKLITQSGFKTEEIRTLITACQ